MRILHQFTGAIDSYAKAFSLLFNPRFSRYLLLPILINTLLIILITWLSISFGRDWADLILGWMGVTDEDWVGVLGFIFSMLIKLGIFFIYFTVFKYLILILLSPFLAFLSEQVESHMSGRDFPFSMAQLLKDIKRAVVVNLRNFVIEITLTILFTLLTFIPVVGLLSPFFILAIQSYFFGFALMDYNAERHRWGRRPTESWMRSNFISVGATGLIFHLCFLIPVLGWIVAPVLSTISGTITFIKIEDGKRS